MKSRRPICVQSTIFLAALIPLVGLIAQAQSGSTEFSPLSPKEQDRFLQAPAHNLPGISFHQLAKLSVGGSLGELGFSVSVSGDTVVAATPYGSEGCGFHCSKSASNLFVKPTSGWTNMIDTADLFAVVWAISISGDTIVAGNPYADSYQGEAYVFVKPTGGWGDVTPVATLTASDGRANELFGSSVSISGNTIVVSTPENFNSDVGPGAAYVFVKPANGWTSMTQTAKLTASDGRAGDDLGFSVAISGNTVVAGAPNNAGVRGAAYVFVEPASGWKNMTQTAKLTASDGDAPDSLGISVAISGGTVVAGAPNESTLRHDGGVYLFLRPDSGWADETETAKLTSSDGKPNDQYAWSVATNGNAVIAGATQHYTLTSSGPGEAYVFLKPKQGWANATESQKLFASDGKDGDGFGTSVSLSNNTVLIGAPQVDNQGIHGPGAAYVFGH
jgi:FG-GAP repeat